MACYFPSQVILCHPVVLFWWKSVSWQTPTRYLGTNTTRYLVLLWVRGLSEHHIYTFFVNSYVPGNKVLLLSVSCISVHIHLPSHNGEKLSLSRLRVCAVRSFWSCSPPILELSMTSWLLCDLWPTCMVLWKRMTEALSIVHVNIPRSNQGASVNGKKRRSKACICKNQCTF